MRVAGATAVRFLVPSLIFGLLLILAVPAPVRATTESTDPTCSHRDLPPPPVNSSEEPPPDQPSPDPLPVPTTALGGERMDECDLVLPAEAPDPPDDLTATSWLLQDLDTGDVLAADDPHGRLRPASLIKTLLALVVIDEFEPDDTVVPSEEDADQECTCVGISAGTEYTVEKLLHGLLMVSGNDVAHALATAVGGTETAVNKMNAMAEHLGALDTRAATPSGLDGPGTVTSAYDMGLIFQHALEQPRYAEAVGTQELVFPGEEGEPDFPIHNDNKLWDSYPGFLGGKTGFTDNSRHTYVGGAEHEGTRLGVVLLRAEQKPTRVADQAEQLLDYGFELATLGAAPVGELTTSTPEPTSETSFPQPDADMAESGSNTDNVSGNVGWIVALGGSALVLGGLFVIRRRGKSRQPK